MMNPKKWRAKNNKKILKGTRMINTNCFFDVLCSDFKTKINLLVKK